MNTIEELIIKYMQQGLTQAEIANMLKENDIKPNSQSSVEKKINQIKERYEAKTLFHLACILYNEKVLEIEESRNGE
ncbi:hypothetical protein N6B72_05190 [Chryseobacterium soli]|uniref:hypothetical protein n=1 Tax=Chryseobacterium soli TaxID=445961 RepID=UPI002955B790|nr:hypothetical protein [Chryseobacterium soli]MDV7696310.1 hypothetical protein [Chryseobacterium soli]